MLESKNNLVVKIEGNIALITLNRPQVLNALNHELIDELVTSLEDLAGNETVRVVIITGNDKVFAAGADIKEMLDETAISILLKNRFATWDRIRNFKKPLIAAVSGFALGGGMELVMNCDIVVASETAKFGQPEVNLGIIPGAGGTQRLTRLIGKHKAMEMILTGKTIDAQEAKLLGIVNHIAPTSTYLEEAKTIAIAIANKSPIAIQLAKEAILKAFDFSLEEGLEFERKNFYILFSSQDQKEGMSAFLEKRPPKFTGR